MTVPPPPAPPLTDEQVVSRLRGVTVKFSLALVAVLAVGVFFLVPHGVVTIKGLVIGAALGMWSWLGSWGMPTNAIRRAERSGVPVPNAPAVVLAAAFMALAMAEVPALVGLVLVDIDGKDVGPLVVSVPVAIMAIVMNVSGSSVTRRRLARLRG